MTALEKFYKACDESREKRFGADWRNLDWYGNKVRDQEFINQIDEHKRGPQQYTTHTKYKG